MMDPAVEKVKLDTAKVVQDTHFKNEKLEQDEVKIQQEHARKSADVLAKIGQSQQEKKSEEK
jgi:hypothetical protein